MTFADMTSVQAAVERVLQSRGLAWAPLTAGASQIVLFGSRAVGVADEHSDWDLLCVGDGTSLRTREADIIWVTPEQLQSERWLGSELATHVSVYGRWLQGPDDWRHHTRVSPDCIERKGRAVLFHLSRLESLWSLLLPGARMRHIRRLRREVQRFIMLSDGIAVPPTRCLDEKWKLCPFPQENLEALGAAVGLRLRS